MVDLILAHFLFDLIQYDLMAFVHLSIRNIRYGFFQRGFHYIPDCFIVLYAKALSGKNPVLKNIFSMQHDHKQAVP